MTIQHTPGPWHTDKASPFTVKRTDTFLFQDAIAHVNHRPPVGGGIANARLIAAAPDLLEALQAIVATLDQPVQHTDTPGSAAILRTDSRIARETAKRAIAKVTGETK